jgi:hypothetical protein
MTRLKPPIVAAWLLHRFVRQNEALTGDLLEEYRVGRSVGWYWRQVLIAIVVGTVNVIREHKVITVRAILLGWAVSYCFAYLIALPLYKFYAVVLRDFGLPTAGPWWQHYYLLPVAAISCIGSALSGWLVARFHRRQDASMVLVFLASLAIWSLPEFLRLIGDSIGNPRYLPYLLTQTINFGITAISILLGGLWVPRWQEKLTRRCV